MKTERNSLLSVAALGVDVRGSRLLCDITFELLSGEIIALLGANGAGKSTLLKILTRVTAPSSGHGVVRGRVGTILEVNC